MIALSIGGSDTAENLQVLCSECHRWKTRRDLRNLRFYRRLAKRCLAEGKSVNPVEIRAKIDEYDFWNKETRQINCEFDKDEPMITPESIDRDAMLMKRIKERLRSRNTAFKA